MTHTCPHCHIKVDGHVRPHCEGLSCGWLRCTSCNAIIDLIRARFACKADECVTRGSHP